MDDLFGLHREARIAKSSVREIYTPHQPVRSRELFFGRSKEVQSLIEHLNTPGQHALLFGDRGVGKSSLANIACELILQHIIEGKLLIKRCDADDDFASIVESLLSEVGIDLRVDSVESKKEEGGSAGVAVPLIRAQVNTKSSSTIRKSGVSRGAVTASFVAKQIRGLKALFLVDEVDSIRSQEDKRRLAELIKLLSDEGSPLKIMLVGIADTSADLVAGHPSVHRCLRETRLGRMTADELVQIVKSGQTRLKIQFTSEAIDKIVTVSSGYAHFTHLLALKAAEDAIVDGRRNIDHNHVELATRRAVEDVEGSLKRAYAAAVRSSGTEEYERILLAASLCRAEEIAASDLRQMYFKLFKSEIRQASLNNYLQRLIANDSSRILRRIAKGVYRFNDPRMPSYVRISQSYLGDSPD